MPLPPSDPLHQITEDEIVTLFQKATGGEDPESVEMALIETDIRKYRGGAITLKPKPGSTMAGQPLAPACTSTPDGSASTSTSTGDTALSKAAAAFGGAASKMGLDGGAGKGAWSRLASANQGKMSLLIKDLFSPGELP